MQEIHISMREIQISMRNPANSNEYLLLNCNLLENIADRRTFQCIVHGDIFVNIFFCVSQYVI